MLFCLIFSLRSELQACIGRNQYVDQLSPPAPLVLKLQWTLNSCSGVCHHFTYQADSFAYLSICYRLLRIMCRKQGTGGTGAGAVMSHHHRRKTVHLNVCLCLNNNSKNETRRHSRTAEPQLGGRGQPMAAVLSSWPATLATPRSRLTASSPHRHALAHGTVQRRASSHGPALSL